MLPDRPDTTQEITALHYTTLQRAELLLCLHAPIPNLIFIIVIIIITSALDPFPHLLRYSMPSERGLGYRAACTCLCTADG